MTGDDELVVVAAVIPVEEPPVIEPPVEPPVVTPVETKKATVDRARCAVCGAILSEHVLKQQKKRKRYCFVHSRLQQFWSFETKTQGV